MSIRSLGAFAGGVAGGIDRSADTAIKKRAMDDATAFNQAMLDLMKQHSPQVAETLAQQPAPGAPTAMPGPAAQTFPVKPREEIRERDLMQFPKLPFMG